jgi:hypothetical protein
LTNASIANVTAYNASVTTGGMVLVSSATASASASIVLHWEIIKNINSIL